MGFIRGYTTLKLNRIFWAEVGLSASCAALAVMTAIWPEWMELVLHIDPDAGNGAAEWALLAVFALLAVVGIVAARGELYRARARASIIRT